jgi:hypothetical protein
MLLIWDIHANAKHVQAIINNIREFLKAHDDEKNVIFLGDYMYMFSYDRGALSQLFDLFLEVRHSGKNAYILTGNHDWLAQWFIYQEGKKVADILNRSKTLNWDSTDKHHTTHPQIHFITEPITYTIEGQEILFMPYNKWFLTHYKDTLLEKHNTHIWQDVPWEVWENNTITSSIATEWKPTNQSPSILQENMSPKATIYNDCLALLNSINPNEQLSSALNLYLLDTYTPWMSLIHHYYTAHIRFPWQEAQFDYKDIALHPLRTKYATHVISGHLHKAFIHDNYFCAWSVWYTTSGERDQCKWLWKWQTSTTQPLYQAREISVNPYYKIAHSNDLDSSAVLQYMETVRTNHKNLFPQASVQRSHDSIYSLENTTLILYTNQSVTDIEQTITPELKSQIGDIQLKQTLAGQKDMSDLIDLSQYNIQQSLLDRKELVKKYIMSRYWDESDKYRTVLSELGIL